MCCGRAVAFPLALCAFALAPPRAGAQCDSFRRGDSNADGRVDISDPIATLTSLFAGGARIVCEDAADANDTGLIDITDAVFTLNFLFNGGPPLPAPGTDACGSDPTGDRLSCIDQECKPAPAIVDESAFASFRYSQSPGLGFCPRTGKVFGASIEREEDGSYRLEHSLLEEGVPGDPRCLPEVFSSPCLIPVSQPSRLLTPAEADLVRSRFASIEVNVSEDPLCRCIAFDPCRIGRYAWDDRRTSDFRCSPPFLEREETEAILDLLESLRTSP